MRELLDFLTLSLSKGEEIQITIMLLKLVAPDQRAAFRSAFI